MNPNLANFTDVLGDEICNSQPMSLPSSGDSSKCLPVGEGRYSPTRPIVRPAKGTGQRGHLRSIEEIDPKYRDVFTYKYFNLVQSSVIEDAIYSDKSIVVCAPTGSGKTAVFEMAIVQLLMELEEKQYNEDFKIIYMAPVKALCTERLTEWYPKFTKLGLLCIEVTGDTDVDFTQLKPYKIIITTPEKWDMLTRRWRDHRGLVEVIKLFLIDEVHILNDELRGPVLEAVVSRMKTIESSAQSVHRIEQLQKELKGEVVSKKSATRIRFVAVSATVSNPEDVANWLGSSEKPAVFYKFGDECRPVKLKRIVEGYPCPEGSSIFKFDIILNYKLWPVIQKYHSGKPTLIFCNTRKSVILTAETLSRELTISFNAEQRAKLTALASSIKNKKLQALVMSGVGCHHAGLLYEERQNIEFAFRNRDLPILITTTTLAMGVNLPAHLVIVKNTQQYVNGAYQEYSISTVLQMVGRAGRPQFDTEATAVIMTRLVDKPRYQALVGGCEPLQSFLHKRLAENLNSEAALGTVGDVAQCVQWLRSTFLYIRAARDPKKYLGLPLNSPQHLISKKIEELCVKAMNGLASSGLITMDEASCIESTEAGRLMSIFYLDLETMKNIMKIEGSESLERLLAIICESHELADMHLRVDERRCLNTLNRNNAAATIRFPMKGKISTRQMKLNCVIQAVLGCLSIPDPSLNQEAMKIMRIADRVCKCLVTYITRPDLKAVQPQFHSAVLNSITMAKCVSAHLWENSPFVSKQLKGIGPTFSTLLASAGKVNFMLLEESHPRDLERIMNKGAPAGNIIRKQISLLPKYQLTMTPIDDKIVNMQLVLLNQAFLSENMDNLTAGDSHKFYIIVGDSSNHLLLLATYKDRDLISVFNGTITHEVRRKHNFEHKIFAHCISSNFVGIDAQSEYLFNDLGQRQGMSLPDTPKTGMPIKKYVERQTCITDTFKERKRKNVNTIDKTQSNEKKKRENALMENFKHLKESFEATSKNIKRNLNLSSKDNEILTAKVVDTNMVPYIDNINVVPTVSNDPVKENLITLSDQNHCNEDIDSDEFIDDDKIDSILSEIETEMCKSKGSTVNTYASGKINNWYAGQHNLHQSKPICKPIRDTRKRKPNNSKSNYTFIELLENNSTLGDEENETNTSRKDNGFSETIKSHIQKYLSKTRDNAAKSPDRKLELLLNPASNNHDVLIKGQKGSLQENPLDDEIPASPPYNQYPNYEIKEILGKNDCVEESNNVVNIQRKQNVEFITCEDAQDKSKKTHEFNYENNHYNDDARVFRDDLKDNNNKNYKLLQNNLNICIDNEMELVTATKGEMSILKNTSPMALAVRSRDNIPESAKTANDTESNQLNLNISNLHLSTPTTSAMTKCDENNSSTSKEVVCNLEEPVTKIYNKLKKAHEINFSEISLLPTENSIPKCIPLSNNFMKSVKFNNANICSDIQQHNTFYRNNSLMPNNTSIGEDSPTTHLNQALGNSNPYTPGAKLPPWDIINNMNSPSNETKPNQTKTEYIKKYCYSTSKIDTFTKHTPEYSVQVIKRVRLDMDVTEIVTRKPNSDQNMKSDYEETVKKCGDTLTHDKISFQNKSSSIDKRGININYTRDKPKESSEPIQKSRREDSNFDMMAQKNQIEAKNDPVKSFNDNIRRCTATFSKYNDHLAEKLTESSIKENQAMLNTDARQVTQTLSSDAVRITDDNENEYTMDAPEMYKLNVNNILKKYGRILGKSIAKNVPLNCLAHNKSAKENQSPNIKNTKPFKISDIHKLHATIPSTIIDDHKPGVSEKTKQLIIECCAPEVYERQKMKINQSIQNPDIGEVQTANSKDEYISDTDLDSYLPTDVDLEPSEDFKIDQSMFDPKTLLKCVVNDNSDEIIPPPPEFCNGRTGSQGREAVNFTIADSFKCENEPQFGVCYQDEKNNESIFEDPDATNLTPSREIETWNLSRNDTWDSCNSLNLSPVKSFTVMRRNTMNNISRNSVTSRRDKLGKFMFNRKVKLKMRK